MIDKVQEKVQHVTNITTPSGAIVTATGAWTLNEWMVVGGFLVAVASFIVNWYYQYKRDKRQQEAHNNRL